MQVDRFERKETLVEEFRRTDPAQLKYRPLQSSPYSSKFALKRPDDYDLLNCDKNRLRNQSISSGHYLHEEYYHNSSSSLPPDNLAPATAVYGTRQSPASIKFASDLSQKSECDSCKSREQNPPTARYDNQSKSAVSIPCQQHQSKKTPTEATEANAIVPIESQCDSAETAPAGVPPPLVGAGKIINSPEGFSIQLNVEYFQPSDLKVQILCLPSFHFHKSGHKIWIPTDPTQQNGLIGANLNLAQNTRLYTEIRITLSDGKLSVDGSNVESYDDAANTYFKRNFNRTYAIPADIRHETIKSYVSQEGVLVITGKRKQWKETEIGIIRVPSIKDIPACKIDEKNRREEAPKASEVVEKYDATAKYGGAPKEIGATNQVLTVRHAAAPPQPQPQAGACPTSRIMGASLTKQLQFA